MPRKSSLDLVALVTGLIFGFGTNLVTADPAGWWGPLRSIDEYAPIWLSTGVAGVVIWELVRRRAARRQTPWTRPDSPYPGLQAFGEDRAGVFFGRTEEIAEITGRLAVGGPAWQRFVTVVGASGSGKSSLIAAGVLPKLRRRWKVLGPIRPGVEPFTALAHALLVRESEEADRGSILRCAAELYGEATGLASDPRRAPRVLTAALVAAQGRHSRILLVIDQLEDVFRSVPAEERDLFLDLLGAALQAHPHLYVLAALPPDSLREAAVIRHPNLFRVKYPLGALRPRQVREAIAGPARAAGVDIDGSVVEALTVEATAGDALPLLGQLLRELYERAGDSHEIGRHLYELTGPLSEAIGRHAERVYTVLVEACSPEMIDSVLLKFVSWDERGFMRRSVARYELGEQAYAIVMSLRSARLVTEADQAGEAFDLVHEAILRHWPRLHELLLHHEGALRRITELERRARAWDSGGRSADDLLRGRRLEEAEETVSSTVVSPALLRLLEASRARETEGNEARADSVAVWAQQVYSREGNRELALALAAAACEEWAPTATAVLTLWGIACEPSAEFLDLGHSGKVLSLGWDQETGCLRSIGTDGVMCTWSRDGELVDHRYLGSGLPEAAGLSGSGKAYWVVGADGTVTVRRTDDASFTATSREHGGRREPVLATSFSGRTIVAQFEFSGIHIVEWAEGEDGEENRQWFVEAPHAEKLRCSPRGDMLAADHFGDLQMFRVADGQMLWRTGTSDEARHVLLDWSTDGERVAILLDGVLKVRAAGDGAVLDEWHIGDQASALAWSPDGRFLAVGPGMGAEDQCLTVWRIADHEIQQTIEVERGVEEIAWSADSATLAWRVWAGGMWICAVGSHHPRHLLSGPLSSASWSSERVVATSLGSDAVYVAHPDHEIRIREITRAQDPRPSEVRCSPDGELVAIGFRARVEIREVADGLCRTVLEPASNVLSPVKWAPDSSLVATVGHDFWLHEDDQVEIWDSVVGVRVASMTAVARMGNALTWSPDGLRLAGAAADGTVFIWDARSGRRLVTVSSTSGGVRDLDWSPDGGKVAVLGEDCRIRVLNAQDGEEDLQTVSVGEDARAVVWSPDSRYLATGGGGWASFWLAASGACHTVSRFGGRQILDAQWSADARRFMVTCEDHVRYAWDLPQRTDGPACASLLERAGMDVRALTDEERRRFGLSARLST
ncbi:AAA family ATPase [Streptomyces ochraceiscleroticus]|uniref:AAA family ATPase n=1 Tax=Streptomyces ochraceiscleroticus TaxID=47761 RepID=A0ABW1MU90_9ACTN|nr:AAA family ATPase [Streptomyces ochraceiscleroticus]